MKKNIMLIITLLIIIMFMQGCSSNTTSNNQQQNFETHQLYKPHELEILYKGEGNPYDKLVSLIKEKGTILNNGISITYSIIRDDGLKMEYKKRGENEFIFCKDKDRAFSSHAHPELGNSWIYYNYTIYNESIIYNYPEQIIEYLTYFHEKIQSS